MGVWLCGATIEAPHEKLQSSVEISSLSWKTLWGNELIFTYWCVVVERALITLDRVELLYGLSVRSMISR